ncbi:MAG TPA: hypothetical protein GX514_08905 [Thermoanaerobacterales bacterium]|uniref:hypothetical protein n=1 Tax=Tepidanaerobacter sp. GT38 TaxID=2722793 RepID=UPI00178F166A|nr:hypothetical protein [Tepidanaerobacter sp. GT38]MCG1012475.1 hypothetical protein [Tepidanaerobacter sp. GT38]HHY42940.1 hypothetical protein [Thermoanaerobacterales bacterium]
MWAVIYIATDRETADRVAKAIKEEGILVKTREVMKSKRRGCCIEIIVPESEAQEAQNVILEKNLLT